MKSSIKILLKTFAIRSIILFLVWIVAYHGFIQPHGKADQWLTEKVVQSTKKGLDILGYDTTANSDFKDQADSNRFIYIEGQPVVLVGDKCNGFELIALFIGFILCFPGPIKFKLIVMPIGSLIVYGINVLREIVLALNYKYFQQSFDFNHKYTYVFIVYLTIFLIWRFWLNHYSAIGKKVNLNHDNG